MLNIASASDAEHNEGYIHYHQKATNPLPSSYSIDKKTSNVHLKISNKPGMSDFTSLIQHSITSHSCNNQRRRRNKWHLNWKGRSRTLYIFRWHDTVHTEHQIFLTHTQKKLLDLIKEFKKVGGYKINIQKSLAFCYANYKWRERKIMKQSHS